MALSSAERERSRDRELVLKHQHSFSESGRASVPMWDSADPDRAPPPLPLNPNPNSPTVTTRANTSAGIAAAAQALHDKARESAGPSPYTTNPMPQKSPERSLIKGAAHKRLQSLQTPSVRDLRGFLDGAKSPEKPAERLGGRSNTPTFKEVDRDIFSSSPEKGPTRSGTPTPLGRDSLKDTPSLRPSIRAAPKAILGENTPPSATMLALQTMPARDVDLPLDIVTNSTSTRTPQKFDSLSSQIHSLTTIATNLQREMAQLSRRSKDNATDLISLKEATNARDEDIRKSLRELVNTVNASNSTPGLLGAPPNVSRSSSSFGLHHSPPSATKTFTLPRIPSPGSFMIDERVGSPSPYSVEGAASVAMLEKIIREMVTKEGQDRLLSTLSQLLDKYGQESIDKSKSTAQKVEELAEFIKSQGQALVPVRGRIGDDTGKGNTALDTARFGQLAKTSRDLDPSGTAGSDGPKPFSSPKAADFVSAEMLKLLKKIKDSVTESGGLTAEVKALVRDLRSEVLGMGREIGRKIDEVDEADRIHDGKSREDIARIVTEGLAQLKEHMDRVIRDKRRQSQSSIVSRSTVDSREIQDIVKHTLAERGLDHGITNMSADSGLDKESILAAVKEAYEAYKPEIELQQFGLERDEILQCLKEGLEDYRSSGASQDRAVMNRDEIMDAVQEALQHFTPPAPVSEAHEIREEVLSAVRECLEDLRPFTQTPGLTPGSNITREAVLEAIRDGLEAHGINAPRELEISRDDLFEAVKAGLEGSGTPFGKYGEEVLNHLHGLVDDMRVEFKQYSAANGRDTEQVLDAVKDGLESLRAEIESYVDRAQDVTGKDEIVETVRSGLDILRADVKEFVAAGPEGDTAVSRHDMLQYIKAEFEHLHHVIADQSSASRDKPQEQSEILAALKNGFDALRIQVHGSDVPDEATEEILETIQTEFDQLRDVVMGDELADKDQVLTSFQEALRVLARKLKSKSNPTANFDELLLAMKAESEHLRETLATTLLRSGASADQGQIIDAVRESFEGLRSQLAADHSNASKESLSAIQEELQHLREALATTMTRGGADLDKEEILEALRAANEQHQGVDNEMLGALRAEMEHLRQSVATGLVHSSSRADTEEVLETVRLGLDDLRSHLDKKLDNPERQMSATNEIIDALTDGLDGLRTDITKATDKPIDMTVSYEILETLKEGLMSVREDIKRLRNVDCGQTTDNAVVLAEGNVAPAASDTTSQPEKADTLRRTDLEKMEVLIAQLQIKVEAMDANIQNPPVPAQAPVSETPEGAPTQLDLDGIETVLKELQSTVSALASREAMEDVAKKEDTDAIEILLQNTKAKLDEMNPTDLTGAAKEQLETIEGVARITNDAVEELSARITATGATKDDVALVEVLVQDIKSALESVKDGIAPEDEAQKPVTKSDFDVLGILCTEIKAKVAEMNVPDTDNSLSKADLEELTEIIHSFRASHDKLRESYETDIAVTAKAFDDRKDEARDLVERITDVKEYLSELKEEVKSKVEESGQGFEDIQATIKGLDDTIGSNFNISADVKELMETINREFERAHGSIEGLKIEHEEKSMEALEKHNEVSSGVIGAITNKIEEHFNVLMAKYDDAQIAAESQMKAMEEKSAQQQELFDGTKAMADDLRLTIDTLGTSVLALTSSFTETTDKLSGDSKTLYNRIDESIATLENISTKVAGTNEGLESSRAEAKALHETTQEDIKKVVLNLGDVRENVIEYNPKIMMTLQEVLARIAQQNEQSQKAQELAQEQAQAAAEDSKARMEEIKTTFSALPALLPPPSQTQLEPAEDPIDAEIREKLDKLVAHATDSEKSLANLSRLDEIHERVLKTANELSEFIALQASRVTEDRSSETNEGNELALVLETHHTQKDRLESELRALEHEKESLREAVDALRTEKETLATQKMRLTAEVSSLQTALSIRREELNMMDAKADALERRILEGIMDHSRALLLTKSATSRAAAPANTVQRAASNASNSTISSLPPNKLATNGLAMALKSRPAPRRGNLGGPVSASRRILSLNQISHNVPSGGAAFSGVGGLLDTNGGGMKRSHSVKSQSARKSSWGGRSFSLADKENGALSEEDEVEGRDGAAVHELDEAESNSIYHDNDAVSDAGTERRNSILTATGTDGGQTYASGSFDTGSYTDTLTRATESERPESCISPSEMSYGPGSSYMTRTETDGRTSLGSTVRSTLGPGTVEEEDEEDEEGYGVESPNEETHTQVPERVDMAPGVTDLMLDAPRDGYAQDAEDIGKQLAAFDAPSDSGLGSDLPTAGMVGDIDYFRRAAEEE